MTDTSELQPGQPPSRQNFGRLMFGVLLVTLAAGLGALGLSIYNTARFDDRVQAYVRSHVTELRSVRWVLVASY